MKYNSKFSSSVTLAPAGGPQLQGQTVTSGVGGADPWGGEDRAGVGGRRAFGGVIETAQALLLPR